MCTYVCVTVSRKFIYTCYFTRKKEKKTKSVEFQIFKFTNKILRFTSHFIYLKEIYLKFWGFSCYRYTANNMQ